MVGKSNPIFNARQSKISPGRILWLIKESLGTLIALDFQSFRLHSYKLHL